MTSRKKPNLSYDLKLIKDHDSLDDLPGYAVVVFERLKSGDVKFSRIINSGERFKKFPFRNARDYFAIAVNESVLPFSFEVPVSLDDDKTFEMPLRFNLTFRAKNPRLVAALHAQDPLQSSIGMFAKSIKRNFRSQNWEDVKDPVRAFEKLVLDAERPRLIQHAATMGIEILKLDFDRHSFALTDDLAASVQKLEISRRREIELLRDAQIDPGLLGKALETLGERGNTPDETRAGGNAQTKGIPSDPEPESPVSPEPEDNLASDTVACSVFAPRKARRGSNIMVQVFAHLEEDEATVKALASEFDEKTQRLGLKRLDQEVERNSKLVFCISLPGLQVDESIQELIWRGSPESVQFGVQIPKDFTADQIVGTVYVTQNSVPFGHLKFLIQIENAEAAQDKEPPEAANTWKRYQYAFISYASPDRPEVLKRVQMLARLHIDFFQDLLTLEPGDRWEQQLYKNIDRCDVFFLFWSTAARDSKWVMKEVRYALDRRRADKFAAPEIVPVIIEGPPPVSPPEELRDIHFNDVFIYFLN